MGLDKYIDLAFALAIGVSIGFPMFGVLTTHRFKHRLDQILRLRTVAFWCIAWMTFVGLIGTSFGWLDGLIRYSGESLKLLTVQQEETQIQAKDTQRSRGSSTRYWITLSTLNQEQIQVSRVHYESLAIDQVVTIAYTTFPKVCWPVGDSFSINKLSNFLFCYVFLIFCSYGFFAFAWLPDCSPEP